MTIDKILTILQIIAPIFTCVFLGVLARKRKMLTQEDIQALQQFVVKFCLPCVLFNSCLTASFAAESLGAMVLVLVTLLTGCLWAFRWGRKRFPYHNLPQLFAAQETGMLGIPLFITLFGAAEAYRMGILDLAQAFVAIPTITVLAASGKEKLSLGGIVKNIFTSPLMIMSLLGLILNVTGAHAVMEKVGVAGVITDTTSFLAQPVSAVMLFGVGYNFSLGKGNRKKIFTISAIHFVSFSVVAAVVFQLAIGLMGQVDDMTRWSLLLYCLLPSSFLAPSLGKNQEDATVASGICSLLTALTLVGFCVISVLVA